MSVEFAKRLEDVVRHEMLILGYEYDRLVEAVEPARGRGGAVVRLHAPYEDLVIEEPEEDLGASAFSARVARRLRMVLEAPERPPGIE